MYQLVTKKDQRYWLTKEETVAIRSELSRGVPFITIRRYDKTINVFDIHDIGIPDWAYPMIKNGHEIRFDGNTPVVQQRFFELRFEDGKWQRYEGMALEEYKTFEDYVGEIKRLN